MSRYVPEIKLYFTVQNTIISPKDLISYCAFPQNIHTRKLGEIKIFYTAFAKNWFLLEKRKLYKNMG